MRNTSRRLAIALLLIVAVGCATGTVQTQFGPRPASEIQSQDIVGDILHSLGDAYASAVLIHDDPATVASESPAVHAAHRAVLLQQHAALQAAWASLVAWKQVAGSKTMADVVGPLKAATPTFLTLAVQMKVLTLDQANSVQNFIKQVFP